MVKIEKTSQTLKLSLNHWPWFWLALTSWLLFTLWSLTIPDLLQGRRTDNDLSIGILLPFVLWSLALYACGKPPEWCLFDKVRGKVILAHSVWRGHEKIERPLSSIVALKLRTRRGFGSLKIEFSSKEELDLFDGPSLFVWRTHLEELQRFLALPPDAVKREDSLL